MSTQIFDVLDWLVDTFSAIEWPADLPVYIVDGPPLTDVSQPMLLYVGWDGNLPAEADSAKAPEDWAFLGNPTSNNRDETIEIPCVLQVRRGDHSLRTRRAEAKMLTGLIVQSLRDANSWQGPPGSAVLWLAISDVVVWQQQSNQGTSLLHHFTIKVRARA
ncbi:hypothetical protein GCM10009765_59000 [Fodinicola feengrottensis]|uniref:Tail terminator n=1 Tax=Fodinicola feengrottensis TaxID=435914 RepID=A0ABN2IB51_9ACTN